MNRISTRIRIVIVTVLTALAYFLTQGVNIGQLMGLDLQLTFDPIRHILLGLIVYIGTYWALFFKIKGERFLTILMFPALGVMAGSFFTELVIRFVFPDGLGQLTFQFLATIFVGFFTYITILTVNILNAYYLNNIPLGQAARAAYFVISLLITFIIYFVVLSNDISLLYKALVFFAVTVLAVYMCLWSIDFAVNERLIVALGIGILITWGQVLLSAWPIDPTYLSLMLNLVFYFVLNMAMETRERLTKWIWIEYAVLYLFIVVVLILLAEWGINGSFI
jgi:hypothetical protein